MAGFTGAYKSMPTKYNDTNCGEIEIRRGANFKYSYDESDSIKNEIISENINQNHTKCIEKYNSYDLIQKNKEEIDKCVIDAVTKEYHIQFESLDTNVELTDKGQELYNKCDKTTNTTTTTEDTTIGTTKENSSLGNSTFIIIGVVVVIIIAIIFILLKKKKQPETVTTNTQEQQAVQQPIQTPVQQVQPQQPNDLQNMFNEQPQQNNDINNNDDII